MNAKYPEFFFRFSGSGKESVKTIGKTESGWSVGDLIRTRLLDNLGSLAEGIRTGNYKVPVNIFLVGGPGNGKTEAAEYFLRRLFGGDTLPESERKDSHLFFHVPVAPGINGVVVVEDATELPLGQLCADIGDYVLREGAEKSTNTYLYLCCVNRGVLANEASASANDPPEGRFLSALSDVVSVGETDSNMWPLAGNTRFKDEPLSTCASSVFVWPMDAESLVDPKLYGDHAENTPGYQLFQRMFEAADSSSCQNCLEKENCPFFENLLAMQTPKGLESVIYCLNAFEIVTGNKLLFRDLLAVANVLFVDSEDAYSKQRGDRQVKTTPCDWVRYHVNMLREGDWKNALASSFALAAKRFNQVLFGDYSEFATLQSLKSRLGKGENAGEFKNIERLLKSIADIGGKRKNTTRAWEIIHRDFAKKMDVALEERFDDLEAIEIAFCSSTKIGSEIARQKRKLSRTLDSFLEQLVKSEERLGNNSFDVSTEKGDVCRRCLQLLQVIGARMTKREIGGTVPAVYNNEDIQVYRKICFDADAHQEVLAYVRQPLKKVLSLGDRYSSHVLQSIGQTQLSPKYIFTIETENNCRISLERSKTLPVSSTSPVDPTPDVVISFSYNENCTKCARIRLTFPLFLALRKIKDGLSVASISEQTFVSLNLLSSKLLGMVSHFAEEPHFSLPGNEMSKFIWLSNQLVREDIQ